MKPWRRPKEQEAAETLLKIIKNGRDKLMNLAEALQ
jgi:hypothetical protein